MLSRRRNYWNLPSLSDVFDDFFDRDVAQFMGGNQPMSMPAVNVREKQDSFEIDVAAPGLNKSDFKVHVENNVLTISAQKEMQVGYDPNTQTETAGPVTGQNQNTAAGQSGNQGHMNNQTPGSEAAAGMGSSSGTGSATGMTASQAQPATVNTGSNQMGRYTRREFSYTSFQRSFSLPENVDQEKISARYQDGILCVTVPKRQQQNARIGRHIDIS